MLTPSLNFLLFSLHPLAYCYFITNWLEQRQGNKKNFNTHWWPFLLPIVPGICLIFLGVIGAIEFAMRYSPEIPSFHYKLFFIFISSCIFFIFLPILAIKKSKNPSGKKPYRLMSLFFLILTLTTLTTHTLLFPSVDLKRINKDRGTLKSILIFIPILEIYHDKFAEFPQKLTQIQADLTRIWFNKTQSNSTKISPPDYSQFREIHYQKLSNNSYKININFLSKKHLPIMSSHILSTNSLNEFVIHSDIKIRKYNVWLGFLPIANQYIQIILKHQN